MTTVLIAAMDVGTTIISVTLVALYPKARSECPICLFWAVESFGT